MNEQDLHHFKQQLLQQQQEVIAPDRESEESTRPVSLDQSSVGRLSRMDAMQSQARPRKTRGGAVYSLYGSAPPWSV